MCLNVAGAVLYGKPKMQAAAANRQWPAAAAIGWLLTIACWNFGRGGKGERKWEREREGGE